MINKKHFRPALLAALALTGGLSGTVQAQAPGPCPNVQTGTYSSYPHFYSDCTVSSVGPGLIPAVGAVETEVTFALDNQGFDPAPGASVPVGQLDDSFIVSMGTDYTGNCTEVQQGSSAGNPSLEDDTVYCAIVATTGGDKIYNRGTWTGTAWTNIQVLSDAISATPTSVPALPLFGLLSLGGLLGLFGARRLGRR